MTKLIAIAAGLLALAGAIFWVTRAIYDAGDHTGSNRIQVLWDADKAATAKLTAEAIAKVTQDRDAALAANEAIQNDYQTKLSAANADGLQFARELRDAEARLAANSSSMPGPNPGQKPAPTLPTSSDDGLTNLLAAAAAECIKNDDALDALVAEINRPL